MLQMAEASYHVATDWVCLLLSVIAHLVLILCEMLRHNTECTVLQRVSHHQKSRQ